MTARRVARERAAVNERDVGNDLLETGPPPRDLLVDKGFTGI
jgi:hypothetical protein